MTQIQPLCVIKLLSMLFNRFSLVMFATVMATSVINSSPGYVDFTLHKTAKSSSEIMKITEIGGQSIDASLINSQFYYQISLEIGTPPQTIDFTIDTGSSDLWVMASSNPFCTTDPLNTTGINCRGSVFAQNTSNTFMSLNQPFEIAYGDHTFANGTLVSDLIRVGNGASLFNASFGLASEANSSTCVFGIGFIGDEGEAHVHRNKTGVYPTYFNVPTLMKQQGIIDTNAYSLWLNDAHAKEGSILFGGVDTSKFDGPLTVMPIYNNYHEYIEHPIQTRVMLNSFKADSTPLVDFDIAVLLDSGTSFSYLPQEVVNAIGASLGFVYEENVGYYFGPSEIAQSNVKEFILGFSGAEIRVPTTDLLVDLTLDDGSPLIIDGNQYSILAMGSADDSYSYILGDVFLRSMYAVFDLDHYEIALAQSRKNATGTPDVSLIEASIPGAIQAPGYASTSTNNSFFNVHSFTPEYPAPIITVDISSSVDTNITLTPAPVQSETITSTATVTATEKRTHSNQWQTVGETSTPSITSVPGIQITTTIVTTTVTTTEWFDITETSISLDQTSLSSSIESQIPDLFISTTSSATAGVQDQTVLVTVTQIQTPPSTSGVQDQTVTVTVTGTETASSASGSVHDQTVLFPQTEPPSSTSASVEDQTVLFTVTGTGTPSSYFTSIEDHTVTVTVTESDSSSSASATVEDRTVTVTETGILSVSSVSSFRQTSESDFSVSEQKSVVFPEISSSTFRDPWSAYWKTRPVSRSSVTQGFATTTRTIAASTESCTDYRSYYHPQGARNPKSVVTFYWANNGFQLN